MKKILIFLFLSIVPQVLKAEKEPGLEYFNHIMYLYESGQYENAKMGFSYCIEKFSAVVSIENCKNYIDFCDQQLERKRQEQQKLRLAKEKAAKAEREAFLQKERDRIDNKLIFINADARTLDSDYSQFSYSIVDGLTDAGYRFTDKQEEALWSIYIMATANKKNPDDYNDKNHRVEVVAFYKIVNESSETIPPGGEGKFYESLGSRTSFSEATYDTYQELCTPLCDAIKHVIK